MRVLCQPGFLSSQGYLKVTKTGFKEALSSAPQTINLLCLTNTLHVMKNTTQRLH